MIQITADLSKVAKALERIAKVLERVFPDQTENSLEPSTEDDVQVISYEGIFQPNPEDAWRDYGPRRNY